MTTDGQGYAEALWYRTTGSDPASIAVSARTNGSSAFREIRLAKAAAAKYALTDSTGNYQSWFEKAPLRHPLVVEIVRADVTVDSLRRIANSDSCAAVRVAFTRIGAGSITPDTVSGYIDTVRVDTAKVNPREYFERTPHIPPPVLVPHCFARANWTLPEGPGRRHARVGLVGAGASQPRSSMLYEAYARANPRLIGGMVLNLDRGFLGVKRGEERTVHIERTLPDGTKMSFDTTLATSRDTVDEKKFSVTPTAFVGVTSPVIAAWHRFAATVGVDPKNLDRDWYGGFSLLRARSGLAAESLPVDVHVLVHVGRDPVLTNPDTCSAQHDCRTRNRIRYKGVAAMFSIDASSLITDLIKKLAGS
jgi:hypothetical protein